LAAVPHAEPTADFGSAAVDFGGGRALCGLLDPVTIAEAARMMNTQERNVRDLCSRRSLTSARKVGGRWLVERSEVLERRAG
jgi:excisionase family DNA binding protein